MTDKQKWPEDAPEMALGQPGLRVVKITRPASGGGFYILPVDPARSMRGAAMTELELFMDEDEPGDSLAFELTTMPEDALLALPEFEGW